MHETKTVPTVTVIGNAVVWLGLVGAVVVHAKLFTLAPSADKIQGYGPTVITLLVAIGSKFVPFIYSIVPPSNEPVADTTVSKLVDTEIIVGSPGFVNAQSMLEIGYTCVEEN